MSADGSFGSPLRHDFKLAEVRALHDLPLFELVDRARQVHKANHPDGQVQLCTLLSVKTGGCPEDCGYCSQSSHHKTPVQPQALLKVDDVVAAARRAKEQGATRFCMGAAWREVKDGPAFDRVIDMVREVKGMGLEACVTLGMLNPDQARRLKEAGLDAYNHNLDTSREHYKSIISTRKFDDRLNTIKNVREAGITVCSGGIIGLGESIDDRCRMLIELANMDPHPESVPVNALTRVEGTPQSEEHTSELQSQTYARSLTDAHGRHSGGDDERTVQRPARGGGMKGAGGDGGNADGAPRDNLAQGQAAPRSPQKVGQIPETALEIKYKKHCKQ